MVTLEACPLFRELSPGELKTLRQAAQEKTFPANQEIFKEGEIRTNPNRTIQPKQRAAPALGTGRERFPEFDVLTTRETKNPRTHAPAGERSSCRSAACSRSIREVIPGPFLRLYAFVVTALSL